MRTRVPKWVTGLVVGTVFLLVLAACGGEDPTAAPTTAPEPTATTAPGQTPAPTATATPEPTFDVAGYFEGKTIRLVANSNPGGGTDAQGRFMATFMSEWIPGNPRIIVSNQPNKDGEYDFASEDAPKDGTYISWTSTPELERGYRNDAVKRSTFKYVGSPVNRDNVTLLYEPESIGLEDGCWQDLAGASASRAITFADELRDVEAGGVTVLSNITIAEELNAPIEYYAVASATTADIYLMWERGDINATTRSSLWYQLPGVREGWVRDGIVRQVADLGANPVRANAESEPTCGNIRDHMSDASVTKLDSFLLPSTYVGKSLWLPPGTPGEVWIALGDAFEAAFTDPDVAASYENFTGDNVVFTPRLRGQELTVQVDSTFEDGISLIQSETTRVLEQYFGA